MFYKKILVLTIVLSLCPVIISLSPERIYAQEITTLKGNLRIPDSSHVQILTMQDGSTLIGRIAEIGPSEIQFVTELGKITIPITKIKEIKEVPVSAMKKGEYWFPNPNATRLYFAPTGRTLKRDEGYFADYYLFFTMFARGVTDNVTIAGGISLFPTIDPEWQMLYFAPKVGLISRNNFALSVGALVVKLPSDLPFVGILYGVGTHGTPDGSITAGLGYGFVGSDLAEKPMIMLGGESRFSRRAAFVTENWIFPGVDRPLISYGIRFFGEAISVDLALVNTIGEGMFLPGFPYIDFVYNF